MSAEIASDILTVDSQRVSTVLEPDTVAEAAAIVSDARRDGRHLVIAGGRTRLSFGAVGGPFDASLSTRRLNRVIHYEPDDMTLAVEPGCTIRQVKTLLEAHNQTLALDAAHEDRATIGASVATGLSGPRRLGSGSLKDWLIGIETLGPDGALAKAGGMVVKNVTGFDMMHVHYGALGAFGLITRVNLKVFPRPACSRTITMRFDDAADAHAAAVSLLASQLQPSAITIANDEGWTVRVRCDAPGSAIDRLADRIVASATTAALAAVRLHGEGDLAVNAFRDVVDLTSGRGVARLPTPASRQLDVLVQLETFHGQRVCADVGSSLIYVAARPSSTWLSQIRTLCANATFLALPADLKAGLDVFGPLSAPNSDVVKRLKSSFDPGGTFNQGRFVLGL
ncbi:MAG TPA: FAD-binding oxidoreductase [Thermomicrobiales bacterium]|nr:FAD-binding oxidoreductase [Thermomicrobiales bacterium]